MHRLFVSDLHLSDDTPDIEAALLAAETEFPSTPSSCWAMFLRHGWATMTTPG